MGKYKKRHKGEKRKKNTNTSSDYTDQSDTHTMNDISTVINGANEVLFGQTDGNVHDTSIGPNPPNPPTSTPLVTSDAGLHNKLDVIMSQLSKLSKLDDIEHRLGSLDNTVACMGNRISEVEKANVEFRQTIDFVSEKVDQYEAKLNSSEIQALVTTVKQQSRAILEMKEEIEAIRNERDDLKDKVVDLQCRSMKNNLIFTGLSGETNTEDTEGVLRDFIYYELGIDSNIEFGNVHRYGKRINGKPRPIVARFLYHKDLAFVKRNAYKLKGSNFGINEQFPAVIEDRRKMLYPVMKRIKRRDRSANVKLVRDKLYVNGALYDDSHDGERMDEGPSGHSQSQYRGFQVREHTGSRNEGMRVSGNGQNRRTNTYYRHGHMQNGSIDNGNRLAQNGSVNNGRSFSDSTLDANGHTQSGSTQNGRQTVTGQVPGDRLIPA
ncbi:hypothetical protein FSP39_011554 [Pinctada imbricata]|uniref:Uncharacterized protein n=1 Tax=Pinctada imbricata TaxID=66713 RepID=A0AA88YKX7_PINIB|nr:hypothetical protein FSP39_011554 [Pinctada imbricata]